METAERKNESVERGSDERADATVLPVSALETTSVTENDDAQLRPKSFGMYSLGDDEVDDAPSNTLLCIESRKEILLPCYIAVVMKRMRNLNELQSCIDLSTTVIIRVDYGDLPKELKDELVSQIKFRVNDTEYKLSEQTAEPKWKKNVFVTTLRIDFDHLHFTDAGVENYEVWKEFPFDSPHIHVRFEMTSLSVTRFAPLKGWKVRHNVHEYFGDAGRPADGLPRELTPEVAAKHKRVMMSFKTGADAMPSFDIYHAGIKVIFPDETKKSGKKVFQYSPIVEYVIPVYRHPGAAMRTMVFPLVVTNLAVIASQLIGRGSYFEYGSVESEEAFNYRIQALITILIALFAFLTYARAKLPDVPVTTVMDKCIFVSVASTAIGIAESVVAGKGSIWGEDYKEAAEVIMWVNFVVFLLLQCYLFGLVSFKWIKHQAVLKSGNPKPASIMRTSFTGQLKALLGRALGGSSPPSKEASVKQVKKSSTGDFDQQVFGLPVTSS